MDDSNIEVGGSLPSESTSSSVDTMAQEKSNEETSYELLLKQQTMFLQWQLENQHKVVTCLSIN